MWDWKVKQKTGQNAENDQVHSVTIKKNIESDVNLIGLIEIQCKIDCIQLIVID